MQSINLPDSSCEGRRARIQTIRLAFRHPASRDNVKLGIDLEPNMVAVWEWLREN